jgi:hypothetical protein
MDAQTGNITPAQSVTQNYCAIGGLPFQLRHPAAWIAMRVVIAVWLVTLGSILISRGYPWGALIYLAAALHLALGYRLLKTSRAAQC